MGWPIALGGIFNRRGERPEWTWHILRIRKRWIQIRKRDIRMGKKKTRRAAKRTTRSKQTAPSPRKRSKVPFIALAVGGALLVTGVYFVHQGDGREKTPPELSEVKKEKVNLREKRPTLSPERFTGRVWVAYQIAREIPEVLDRLYCYCRCRENSGHKNLLSCFVDNHAST